MKLSWLAYLRGQRSSTLHRLPWKVLRFLKFLLDVAQASLFPPVINDKEMQQVVVPGFTMDCLPRWIRSATGVAFFVDPAEREQRIALLRQVAPDASTLIVPKADQICERVFDLLGSGPTPLANRIDWYTDFKSGHRWDPKRYYKCHKPSPYPGGYDIKVPWDLSDCHHFTWLGQAYWITGDEKYAQEFVRQVTDWIVQNPPQFGVNWACAMKVAIRAVNWLFGLHFFRLSPTITDDFLLELARSLLAHGRYIMGNLEGSKEHQYTSNHYLGDLVGLIYLGICCPFFKEAQLWLEFGTSELWNEMFKQVYPDGVDYEGSIPYHRLVTEMFLSTVLLCQRNGIAVPQAVRERLEKMLEFTMYVTKPDGTVPLIGDNDNGRLHRLKVWGEPQKEWVDHRYLLAIGAVLFGRDDFARAAGDQWEEAFWLLGKRAVSFEERCNCEDVPAADLKSRVFPYGGFYIMRHGDLYMIIDAGNNGQGGKGGHAHNDTLSFELYSYGKTFITDPGTYVYTADYEWRNRFRSTAYHNTAVVDEEEMNRFDAHILFHMQNDAVPTVHRWVSTEDYDFFDGEHDGYRRFLNPVIHRRQVYFDREQAFWLIRDEMNGIGWHCFDLYFHLAPMDVQPCGGLPLAYLAGNGTGARLAIVPLRRTGIDCEIEQGWVSFSYGVKLQAPVIRYTQTADVPAEFLTLLLPLQESERLADRWQAIQPRIEKLDWTQL